MRFKAPEHVTAAHLSCGEIPVVDGFVTVPNDAPVSDFAGLCANGFTPVPVEGAAAVAPKATAPTVADKD